MKCPSPCSICGEIVELDALHFYTCECDCGADGQSACTHGVCEDCYYDERDEWP